MKRKYNTFLVLTLLTCCLLLGCGGQAEAASAKSKALKAYKTMLSSKSKANKFFYLDEDGIRLKDLTFATAYIDNNNVPELIVNTFDTQCVFTYQNGKIRCVDRFFFQWKLDDFYYYKKKGVFSGVEGHCDSFSRYYCTLKKGKATRFAYKSMNNSYNMKGQKMLSSAFSRLIAQKGGKGNLTVIRSSQYRKNTSSNRSRYLR